MKRFNLRKLISVLVLLLFVAFFGYYVNTHWQEFRHIRIVSYFYLVMLIVLMPLSFYLTALFFKKSVEPYNLELSFNEYFGLTMITLMGNYLVPFSGLGVRAVYMKKAYKFTYSNFLVTVVANWVTNFLVYTVAGIIALGIFYLRTQKIEWPLLVIFLIVLALSLLSFVKLNLVVKNKTITRIILTIKLWQDYLANRNVVRQLISITFWQFLVAVATLYCAYNAFAFKITFTDSFLPTILSLYSSVIRLVPASFGFYELSIVYPSKVLGLTVTEGLSVSLVIRLVTMFWTFVLGSIFSYILMRKMKESK